MSDVVEKTLASIPKFFGGGSVPSSPKHASSRGFLNFLRLVVRAKSRTEEQLFIKRELQDIQQKLSQPDVKLQQTCDCLCRAVYCSMLGYDVSCVHIYAVKLAQQGTGFEKRLGYLALSLLLHENHELILLIINTIQKDLNSSNLLDNCAALTVICQLVNSELIPTLLPIVQEKLKHPRELVRMKAAMCIHSFVIKAPSLVEHIENNFQQILLDKDPGVMSVGVTICSAVVQKNPDTFPTLTENLVGILKQLIHRRLPSTFEFHNVPMPWLQIQILRTLAVLGKDNERRSQIMYPILQEVLQKVNRKERIGFAVLYECIITISVIHPHTQLIKEAATSVGRFIHSTTLSLKYIGVKALTVLVKCYSEAALEHRITIVELLEDEDLTIQRKTLDLLYNMANSTNVEVVCEKMLEHLGRHTHNKYWQADLATKVTELADRYASTKMWYVDTIIRLLHTCKCQLPADIVNKVIRVIEQDCSTNNTQQVKEFRQYLVKKSTECLVQDEVSGELVKMSAWVIGECAVMLKNLPEDKIISILMKHFNKDSLGVSTRLWITSALTKLVCAKVLKSDNMKQTIEECLQNEKCVVIKQKLTDLLHLMDNGISLTLPSLCNGTTGLQMDFTLSFLDDFVTESLEKGSQPYKSRNIRYYIAQPTEDRRMFAGINLKGYSNTSSVSSGPAAMTTKMSAGQSDGSGGQSESGLNLQGVKRVWGKQGLVADPDDEEESDIGNSIDQSAQGLDKDPEVDDHANSVKLEKEKEKAKRRELASALFGGIASPNQKTPSKPGAASWDSDSDVVDNHDILSPKPLPTADTGGWRNLHHSSMSNPEDSRLPSTVSAEDDTGMPLSNQAFSLMELSNEITPQPDENQPTTYLTNQIQEDICRNLLTNQNEEPLLTAEMSNEMFSLDKLDHAETSEKDTFNDIQNPSSRDSLCNKNDVQIHTKSNTKVWGQKREDSPLNLDERPCLPGRSNVGNFSQDFPVSPESTNGASDPGSDDKLNMTEEDNFDKAVTGTLYDEFADDS